MKVGGPSSRTTPRTCSTILTIALATCKSRPPSGRCPSTRLTLTITEDLDGPGTPRAVQRRHRIARHSKSRYALERVVKPMFPPTMGESVETRGDHLGLNKKAVGRRLQGSLSRHGKACRPSALLFAWSRSLLGPASLYIARLLA